jgi:RND superfamily putative drug exporter
VRMVLMPATLQIFGRANWWFPKRMAKVVPSFLTEVGTGPTARSDALV